MSLSAGTSAVLRRTRICLTVLAVTTATLGVAAPAFAADGSDPAPPAIFVPDDIVVDESPAGSGTALVSFDVQADGSPTPVISCTDASVPVVSPALFTVGTHVIDCTATNDIDSDQDSFTITVNGATTPPGNPPGNPPGGGAAPVADAGGPYTVVEGQPLQLDASGSHDTDGDALTYSWDLNGDGVFGDATGVAPTLSWQQLESRSINDGPATLHPTVQVSDGGTGGTTVSAPTVLTVVNAPPVAFIGGSPSSAKGLSVTFVLSSTDPSVIDQAAGFTYAVSWGDGTSDAPFHAAGAVVRPHTYPAPGSYPVTLTTTDKDGGLSAVVTKTVTVVQLVADVCGSTGSTLVVGGTSGDDTIVVGAGSSASTVAVTVDGVAESVPTSTFDSVVVLAGAGKDAVTFSGTLAVRRIVYGGPGNDTLVAGDGPAVLVGGDGNDVLTGGAARDILVGGSGADTLAGNGDDDILIPGATSFDPPGAAGEQSWCNLQAEWTRTDAPVVARALHLLGLGAGENGSTRFILAGRQRNVGRRNCGDTVIRSAGNDWYLEGLGR
jgi:Ca2+-binding RTX toxin-like protein